MILHSFIMNGMEDPEIYAAEPILAWQNSEQGRWVMNHVTEPPVFHIMHDANTYGHRVVISGNLSPEAQTYFLLKYK